MDVLSSLIKDNQRLNKLKAKLDYSASNLLVKGWILNIIPKNNYDR